MGVDKGRGGEDELPITVEHEYRFGVNRSIAHRRMRCGEREGKGLSVGHVELDPTTDGWPRVRRPETNETTGGMTPHWGI